MPAKLYLSVVAPNGRIKVYVCVCVWGGGGEGGGGGGVCVSSMISEGFDLIKLPTLRIWRHREGI